MKTNKTGISLIVLVITIIILAILAAAVIISITNSGIINNTENAVKEHDLAEVRSLASLAWGEALIEYSGASDVTDATYETYVKTYLTNAGVVVNDYIITATASGVNVQEAIEVSLVSIDGLPYGTYKVAKGIKFIDFAKQQKPKYPNSDEVIWTIEPDGNMSVCDEHWIEIVNNPDVVGAVLTGGGGPVFNANDNEYEGPYIYPDTILHDGDIINVSR